MDGRLTSTRLSRSWPALWSQALSPGLSQSVRRAVGLGPNAVQLPANAASNRDSRKSEADRGDEKYAIVRLTQDQITGARVELAAVAGGTLTRRITVPGTIVPNADRIARVAVKLSGTVAELRKKLGDPVAQDEIVAVLESRDVADAKSEYLAARLTSELHQELFERDKTLWDKASPASSNSFGLAIWPRRKLSRTKKEMPASNINA